MAPPTSLEDATSDLCTKLLNDVRDLGSACALIADYLSKSSTNKLTDAPAMLFHLTARLQAQDQQLILLRHEIDTTLPMVDLGELAKTVQDALYEMQLVLQASGRRTLGVDFLGSVAQDLYHLHEAAVHLSRECRILDDKLCPDIHPWRDEEDLPALKRSMRLAFHAQLVQKLSSDGRQCPICLEEMVDGTDSDPIITKCGHVFCEGCIGIAIEEQQKCPMCRRGLLYRFLFR